MAQASGHARSALRKEARADKTHAARTARVHRYSGDEVSEVPVTRGHYSGIAKKKTALSKVIANYADTVARSKKTGKSFLFAYRVSPDGKIEIVRVDVAEKPAGSPLDAAMVRAKGRGSAKIADILKGENILTAEAFGKLIGKPPARRSTRSERSTKCWACRARPAVSAIRAGRSRPTICPCPAVVKVFEALGGQPWAVYRFLRTAHAELGGATALDALKAVQVEVVLGVASNQAAGASS